MSQSTKEINPGQFTFGRGTRGTTPSKVPTEAEKTAAYARLRQGFDNKTQAVEYLLGLGWSVATICQTIRYDTETSGHSAGDPLRAQHVNHIKTRWLADKTLEAEKAKKANGPTPATTPAPASELRKS
jgi:hypothetical protein